MEGWRDGGIEGWRDGGVEGMERSNRTKKVEARYD